MVSEARRYRCLLVTSTFNFDSGGCFRALVPTATVFLETRIKETMNRNNFHAISPELM